MVKTKAAFQNALKSLILRLLSESVLLARKDVLLDRLNFVRTKNLQKILLALVVPHVHLLS